VSPVFMFSGVSSVGGISAARVYSCLRWAEFLQPVCTVCACVLLCVCVASFEGGYWLTHYVSTSPQCRADGGDPSLLALFRSSRLFLVPCFCLSLSPLTFALLAILANFVSFAFQVLIFCMYRFELVCGCFDF
jgi:hypothetical protein